MDFVHHEKNKETPKTAETSDSGTGSNEPEKLSYTKEGVKESVITAVEAVDVIAGFPLNKVGNPGIVMDSVILIATEEETEPVDIRKEVQARKEKKAKEKAGK